jgi:putative hydrolase of the HAD superfamily
MALKHVIFDFGQVLVRFSPPQITAAFVEDPADRKTVEEVVFARTYWNELDAGRMTEDDVKTAVCERLPAHLHEAACRILDGWIAQLPPIEGMTAQIHALKARGVKVFLLSNISKHFAARWQEIPALRELFSLFDGLVFSGPLGLVKPHPPIFRHLLDTYGLAAEECIFIDDCPPNVDGANAVGIEGYLFDGDVEALAAKLATVGGD